MRLPLSWLSDFVDYIGTPEDLADRLGTSGFEIEGILRPGELQASCLDTKRAADVLGWSPEIDVATGIPSTVRSLLSD